MSAALSKSEYDVNNKEYESIGQCALCHRNITERQWSTYPTCFGVRICENCEECFKRKKIVRRK